MAIGDMTTKGGKEYPGNLTARVIWVCIIAATGGLIFGYDIGISGGVTSMPQFLDKFFPRVYRREESLVPSTDTYCTFNDNKLTLFTSSLYLAAIVATCFASTLTRLCGRKISMVFGGLLFLAGAVINGFAQNVAMLIIGRLLLGFGLGFGNQSVPVFLSETAPYKYRGALSQLFQLSITIGILGANLLNFFTAKMEGDKGWRISLGCAAIPAVLFTLGSLLLGETPNSLIERGKNAEALYRLRTIRGVDNVDEEFNDMVAASEASKQIVHPWRNIFSRQYRPHLTFCVLIPAFQQLTGMNVFMFYAPVLFKTIGFGADASLMSAVITGIVNFLATSVSIFTADKFGRRFLFLEGGAQMFVCQVIIAISIALKFGVDGNPGEISKVYAGIVVTAICAYVAAFAWSWGPLGWLVPSEILPLEVRSNGQSIVVAVNMLFTFFIAEGFLTMLCHMKFGLFIFFAAFVFGMTIFIYKLLPETKGIPIEEMSATIWKNHPVWKKYVADTDKIKDVRDHV